MLTVRLSSIVEEALAKYSLRKGISKSQVVKEALEMYFTQERSTTSPYEAGLDLFGREGSGIKDNSVKYKERIKNKIREKHPG